ncbi:MAG: hypothetical protein LUE27_01150 [Clostridia bacterium]|nr:hypothetical protein [Clostridia bacterium]
MNPADATQNMAEFMEGNTMTRVAKRKLKRLMHLIYAKKYKRGYDWKGYEVYEPVYKEDIYIGGPFVFFVSGDNVWLASREEGFDYIDYSIAMDEATEKAANQS